MILFLFAFEQGRLLQSFSRLRDSDVKLCSHFLLDMRHGCAWLGNQEEVKR